MKFTATFLLSIVTIASKAQVVEYKGKITDRDLRPVKYAIVQVAEQKENAVYCDAEGNFTINVNKEEGKTFSFYCSGYKTRSLPISRLNPNSILIKLDKDQQTFDESENSSSKSKQDILGSKGLSNKSLIKNDKTRARIMGDHSEEYAIYLKSENSGLLDLVYIYVTEYAQPKTEFRIHIYDVGQNKLPGKELTNSNIVLAAKSGNEWVNADVSQFYIDPGKGVFISVEWVNGRQEDKTSQRSTVAIGMTDDYNKLGHVTYRRNYFTGDWEKMRKEGGSKDNPINMMIYGSYAYEK